ncbi:MAG TPA: hypothetical protein VJ719_13080, partial [Chthoniobacterales bacterium]|nr:hypothetical protein [Chthoniobacterales bacterium]
MRWLRVTVAGSSGRRGVLLAGLMGLPGLIQAPTIDVPALASSPVAEENRKIALVDVVTESTHAIRVELSPPAEPHRSFALVEVVTEPNHAINVELSPLIEPQPTASPGRVATQPNYSAKAELSPPAETHRTLALVELVTESNQAGQAQLSPSPSSQSLDAQVTVVTESANSGKVASQSRRRRKKMSVGQVTVVTQTNQFDESVPLPPSEFNPDPGASARESELETAPPELFPPILPQLPEYGQEALPRSLALPRKGVREIVPRRPKLEYPEYAELEPEESLLPSTAPVPNRWFIGFGRWKRYADPSTETPYQKNPKLWHPYLQSKLKGDIPVIGQDIFLNLTLENFVQTEGRKLPTPSGVSAEQPNSSEFFGRGDQFFISNDFSLGIDLFKGETVFMPVEWALRFLVVENHNYIDVRERGAVNPNVQKGTTRDKNFVSLQEAFAEIHIRDLSNNYDFISSRFGIQPFVSDFRGLIYNDTNLGVRIFGNYDNNRWQYNLAVFDQLEKDTFSDLNQLTRREQQIYVANVYRQDLIWKGYTGELSFLANFDNNSRHYDKNGFITRPSPIGTVGDHYLQAYYLGWAGDGHIGWLNIDHALYQVLGEDSLNGIAGQRVDINAQLAALELSIDKNWLRHKVSFFYASGDDDPTDSHATAFDTVLDRPFFFGGPFSFFAHQGFNLPPTAVNFKQRDSLIIDFRTSKAEGQANFVNPGVVIFGYGMDADVTPKLKAFLNANYIRTTTTAVTERVLFTNKASNDFALDFSLGFEYRPLLTENVIVTAGAGFLVPRWGYKNIYRTSTLPVPGF